MKKLVCMILIVLSIFLFCGCGNRNTESTSFYQQVTIVKMPSPPKCKTTDRTSIVNKVINVLAEIQKLPIDDDVNGGWEYMIKLDIDGKEFIYTIGGVFTDSDGRQYRVENYDEIKEKLNKIYTEIDVEEADYT